MGAALQPTRKNLVHLRPQKALHELTGWDMPLDAGVHITALWRPEYINKAGLQDKALTLWNSKGSPNRFTSF